MCFVLFLSLLLLEFLILFQLLLLSFLPSVFPYSNCERKVYGVILQPNHVYSENSNVQTANSICN